MSRLSVSLFAAVLTAVTSVGAQQSAPSRPAPGPIASVADRTAGLRKIDGYFPLYWDDRAGAMLLEIPRLDTEFLLSTGLSAGLGSNDLGLDRGQGGQGKIVTFQRVGPRVMLVQGNQSFRSSSPNALERKSVEDSFAKSILWGFAIAAESNGTLLVEATDFFLRDIHGAAGGLRPGTYRVDRNRSAFYLPNTKGFPKNTEVDRWTHPDLVSCLQFSADGKLLVVGGDKTAQARDVPQKKFRTDPFATACQVTSLAIAPDARRFAVRDTDQQVRVFSSAEDQPNSEPLMPVLPSVAVGNVPPMFLGNDRLVVVDSLKSVRCWDLTKTEIVWEHKIQRVLTSAVSPDGKWIALGEDFELVLLDLASGKPAEQRIKHKNMINAISFHPQSSLLLTAGVDHTARIFELPSGKPFGPPIPHCNAVHRCAWSPDGGSFATIQWDGQLIRVWKRSDLSRKLPAEDLAIVHSTHSPFVRYHEQSNRWLASGFDNGRDRTVFQVMETTSGKPIGPQLTGAGLISDADFIPKSSLIVMVGGGSREDAWRTLDKQKLDEPGYVRFVNSETGQAAFEDLVTHSQAIAVRASLDGQTVVVLCHRGHVVLLNAVTGQRRAELLAFQGKAATYGYVIRDRIRFSPQGDQFVLWGRSGVMELRKTGDGELLFEARHQEGFLHDVQFSPDGKLIATCGSDNAVRFWNTATGASAGQTLNHSGWVFNAQFSRDGRRLLTASSDKHARIWDVSTGTSILATREHNDQVFGVTFLPGDELFLVSTRDGQLTAWDASLGKMIAPARQLSKMILQLSLNNSSSQVLASGMLNPIHVFDWHEWILEPDAQLNREDVRLLGEILSSHRVHESGAATSLTSSEWIERWSKFRERHPNHPQLAVP